MNNIFTFQQEPRRRLQTAVKVSADLLKSFFWDSSSWSWSQWRLVVKRNFSGADETKDTWVGRSRAQETELVRTIVFGCYNILGATRSTICSAIYIYFNHQMQQPKTSWCSCFKSWEEVGVDYCNFQAPCFLWIC